MERDAKTTAEDFLAVLAWGLEKILLPSPHNILKSFESWDYQNRLRPQLRSLERARLVERERSPNGSSYRLTERGRLTAWGGDNPVERWARPWDGHWRVVLFDLPEKNRASRIRLWRWLRDHRFGYLQNSAWITPDPVSHVALPLKHRDLSCDVMLVLEAKPSAGFSHAGIVASAWDFEVINQAYQIHLDVLADADSLLADAATPMQRRQWLAQERLAWLNAVTTDPLLPRAIHPERYLGETAWMQRQQLMTALARQLPRFW
jgi:phenylacetic acid degradation operon negative regulatory protein